MIQPNNLTPFKTLSSLTLQRHRPWRWRLGRRCCRILKLDSHTFGYCPSANTVECRAEVRHAFLWLTMQDGQSLRDGEGSSAPASYPDEIGRWVGLFEAFTFTALQDHFGAAWPRRTWLEGFYESNGGCNRLDCKSRIVINTWAGRRTHRSVILEHNWRPVSRHYENQVNFCRKLCALQYHVGNWFVDSTWFTFLCFYCFFS